MTYVVAFNDINHNNNIWRGMKRYGEYRVHDLP